MVTGKGAWAAIIGTALCSEMGCALLFSEGTGTSSSAGPEASTARTDDADAPRADAVPPASPPYFHVFMTRERFLGTAVGGLAGATVKCNAAAKGSAVKAINTATFVALLEGREQSPLSLPSTISNTWPVEQRIQDHKEGWATADGKPLSGAPNPWGTTWTSQSSFDRRALNINEHSEVIPDDTSAEGKTLPARAWRGEMKLSKLEESADCANWANAPGLVGRWVDANGVMGNALCDDPNGDKQEGYGHLICVEIDPPPVADAGGDAR